MTDALAIIADIRARLDELEASLREPEAPPSTEAGERWITTTQASERFGIGERQLRRLALRLQAQGGSRLAGANWLFDPDALRAIRRR